jgi:hypothetical protein
MLTPKYSIGDTLITADGKEHVVRTFVKDFQRRCVNYRTEKGLLVPEGDVTECIPCGKTPLAERPARIVPIQQIVETPKTEEELTNEKIAAIDALTEEQLKNLITAKGLEIDPEDYATREELASAICEELELI